MIRKTCFTFVTFLTFVPKRSRVYRLTLPSTQTSQPNFIMANVAMRSAFQRLGFTVEAATRITDTQGIDSVEELLLLTDHDVENLCKALKRPGGTIQVAGANQPDPGVQVSLRAETNMKLACYFLRHRVRISRVSHAADITIANTRSVREMKLTEENHENPSDPPTISHKDWPKTMEAIEEYLRNYLGETGIPLAYVVRKDEAVPPEADDPATNYESATDEMVARAPYTDAAGDLLPTFIADRRKTWELLADLGRDDDCWTYLKPAQRSRNGRLAFWSLYNHYLGPNNVDNMSSAAEKQLTSMRYVGEKKRWNFEKYVRMMQDQFEVLNGLKEYGYSGIDERSKVRHLMEGIKTRDLDSIKAQILSNAALRNDFAKCVSLYKDYIVQNDHMKTPDLQIAAMGIGDSPGGGKRRSGGRVEDRYYTKAEYKELPHEDRLELRAMRIARGVEPGNGKPKKGKGKNGKRKGAENLNSSIAALKAAAAAMNKMTAAQDAAASDEEEGEGESSSGGPNRNHSALTRQKKRKTE